MQFSILRASLSRKNVARSYEDRREWTPEGHLRHSRFVRLAALECTFVRVGRSSVVLGARYVYISNAGIGVTNPGINTLYFYDRSLQVAVMFTDDSLDDDGTVSCSRVLHRSLTIERRDEYRLWEAILLFSPSLILAQQLFATLAFEMNSNRQAGRQTRGHSSFQVVIESCGNTGFIAGR